MSDLNSLRSSMEQRMVAHTERMQREQVLLLSVVDRLALSAEQLGDAIADIPVVISPHLKPGTAYLVPKLRFDFSTPMTRSPELEAEIRLQLAQAFGLDRYLLSYFGLDVRPHPYNWLQGEHEGLLAWGQRLFDRGLLDDPEVRWVYQCTVFTAIWEWLKGWVKR